MNINDIIGNKIELGGGDNPAIHPNVDVREGKNVDIVADFNKPLDMLKSNYYDFVYCRYAIEHISWRSVKQFVSEIARILKPGGSCYIITANLKEQARVIANREVWEGDYESRLLFGGQDYGENTHSSGMSPEYAVRLFGESRMPSSA